MNTLFTPVTEEDLKRCKRAALEVFKYEQPNQIESITTFKICSQHALLDLLYCVETKYRDSKRGPNKDGVIRVFSVYMGQVLGISMLKYKELVEVENLNGGNQSLSLSTIHWDNKSLVETLNMWINKGVEMVGV